MIRELIKKWFKSSRVFNFNVVERDSWVAQQAELISPGLFVLDVGAGSCPYRKYFSHCNYKTQDFLALPPEQLRGNIGYDKIDYCSDATEIPVPDESFDIILCTEVLEHVPDPIKLVHELSRILKPNGKLLLSAPLGSGIHQSPYHFYGGYTPYWYHKFLAEAGFKEITVVANGGFFKHYGQESIRFAQMTIPWGLNLGIIFRIIWMPLWILFLPFFLLIFPVLCNIMDKTDINKDFTVGYHVVAIKR